jgi:hypothetical protein
MTTTLAAVVSDPKLLQELSPEDASSMAIEAAHLVVKLAERARAEVPSDDDVMLDTNEAARLLGISAITLRQRMRRHGHYLSAVRSGDFRNHRFSKRALLATLRKPLKRA